MENEELLMIIGVILAYILGAGSMYIFLVFNDYIEKGDKK